MIKLIIDNVYITILNASRECEYEVWDKLSFEVQEYGATYTKRRHLYNRKTKKTYTGLLNYVIEIFDERGEEYEIEDTRMKWESNADFKLVEYIDEEKKIKLEARPYQKNIIDNCEERACLQAATGAGKTFMMAAILAKFNVKPVAVFADKLTLCEQLKKEFEKFLGMPIGIVGGGMNQKEDITVYSIQSASEEDVKDVKMIMFDECLKYDQKVLMENGIYKEIGKLVDEKSTEKVMSYNHKTKKIEPKKIISHSKTPLKQNNKKLMKIKVRKADGTVEILECTDNHKIWVESLNKYIYARDLVKGQKVKTLKK